MKNLFASASYSFNNFYNNLTLPGQMIFTIIMFLIMILCILLFITYIVQSLNAKKRITKLKEKLKNSHFKITKEEKQPSQKEISKKTDIKDIADAINDALKDEPVTLTDFEEDQEKTAIISIDELMKKANDLELIDDDEDTGINYLEKYNLDSAEVVQPKDEDTLNKEVKAFKVSQVISPIYGVKKEIINNDRKA